MDTIFNELSGWGKVGSPGAYLGVALVHAHQGLAVLVHLDAPAGHRLPPAKRQTKRQQGSDGPFKVETSVRVKVAPLCRSRAGLYAPIRDWPQCAGR